MTLALGPAVDPATTWAAADLVATSPSITPDFPTTEPRLRAALRALVDARAGGDPTVPALVSEADLFLRLCPAPTIGVTGTKGKTTTASLTAAVLAADPDHPVVLGGNIGIPIVERLPELTPDHRVVDELSELQLPTLSRGTTVAVYTNVTSDHLDRHGSLEGYRRVKRRLAELVDPAGALVLNAEDPVVAGVRGPGGRDDDPLPARRAARGRARRRGRLDRGRRCAAPRAGRRRTRPRPASGRPDHARGRARDPGRAQRLERPGRHRGRTRVRGRRRPGIRRAAAAFTGVEHRLEPVAVVDGVRFINDSQGTQPDAVIAALRAFEPADRADRRRSRQGHRPDRARARWSPSGRPRRSSSARAARRSSGRSGRPGWPGPSEPPTSRRRSPGPTPSPATSWRPARPAAAMRRAMPRRPSCSARPPPASTCSWTMPPGAGHSRRPSRRLAAARAGRGDR